MSAPSPRRPKRGKRVQHARDQDASIFAGILEDLVHRVPGAVAAALVDADGETVDYWSSADPFDVKIAAAHLRIVLHDIAGRFGAGRYVIVRGSRRSLFARSLPDSYALVVTLRRRAGFTASTRAFDACELALCREAGWPLPTSLHRWLPVEVACDRRGRPSSFRPRERAAPQPVHVLGAVVGIGPREKGFRVRLESGAELTIVRESGGFWYADEPH